MNSNTTYSPFIEHSFRRLTLLIHQQDIRDTIANKPSNQSCDASSSVTNITNNEFVSLPSKSRSYQRSISDKSNNIKDTKVKVEPISKTHRTYMRPPKNRTTMPTRCSSSQLSDRSDISLNHSFDSPCSQTITKQEESNELPVHIPIEKTLYDIKFERDRQNDIRQKYDIPSPFQRKWLRQPRYIPQERPNCGQIQQSQNQ